VRGRVDAGPVGGYLSPRSRLAPDVQVPPELSHHSISNWLGATSGEHCLDQRASPAIVIGQQDFDGTFRHRLKIGGTAAALAGIHSVKYRFSDDPHKMIIEIALSNGDPSPGITMKRSSPESREFAGSLVNLVRA